MRPKLTFRQSITAGLIAGLVAAVVNAGLFFAFHATGVLHDGVYVQPPRQPLTLVPVLMASLVPSLIGSLVFFLLERFTNRGYRLFSILALVLAVLSLISPFTVPVNGTLGYALVLCAMHLVVALVLVYVIGQRVKQRALVSAQAPVAY